MALSRRDYYDIADAVRGMLLTAQNKRHVAERLAEAFYERNAAFNHERFYMACGTWCRDDAKGVNDNVKVW
jgi:hypothetical protein